jgi:hypothetical protein
MPDEPTREYARLAALELDGRPIEITSAELVWVQHWRGDEPAQREWELVGRTYQHDRLRDGAQAIALTADGRRLKGRVVLWSSSSRGFAVFKGVGLGDLVEAG